MAGVEQGNISNEEFMEEVAGYECSCRNSNGFKDKNKKANCWKWGRNLFYRWRSRRFEDDFEADDERSKFASSKVSSSTSAMLCAAIFPPATRV